MWWGAEEENDNLPSEDEKELMSQLRDTFKDEFEKRAAEGRDHPCFFGDFGLCRVIRGSDGKLEMAVEWFRKFLEKMTEYNVDEIVAEMTAKVDECGLDKLSLAMLPYSEEISKCFRGVFSAPTRTPKGDVIQYIAAIDFDKKGIFDELDWQQWVRFQRCMTIVRCIECDRLSRAQGRMVKCVTLADLEGCTLENLFFQPFDVLHEMEVNQFAKDIAAEILGPVYIVNPSWTISTLWSFVKRLAPERFIRKFKFTSGGGDGMGDAAFLEMVGGKDELKALYATREGLATIREASIEKVEGDQLATEKEKERIAKIRGDFKEALDKRAADGKDYPFLFSDMYLTRVVRGTGGSYKAATMWFKRMLETLEEDKTDELIQALLDKIKAGGKMDDLSMLPHYEEIKNHFRCVPSGMQLSPKGDLVQYYSFTDMDRKGILEKVEWEHWVQFIRSMIFLTLIRLDQEAQAQGRLTKVVCLWDMIGSTLGGMSMPEFDTMNSAAANFFFEKVAIEIAGPQYVLNAPWLVVRFYNWFSSFMPEKFTRKFQIRNDDASNDAEFAEAIGGKIQLQKLLGSRVGLIEGLTEKRAGTHDITAGGFFEKFQDYKAGQVILWNFEVTQGYADGLLGTSDLHFSAKAFELPEIVPGTETDMEGISKTAAPDTWVKAEEGKIMGSFKAESNGFLQLRWSNEHSRMRNKSIRWGVKVLEIDMGGQDTEPSAEDFEDALED